MKLRLTSFALLFALMSAFVLIPASSVAAKPNKPNPLKGVRAHGRFGEATVNVTGFAVNAAGKLVASGTVTSPTRGQLSTFSDAEVTVAPNATCTILNLVIAPIDINLLGLRVQTSTITLVVTAEEGEGQLLGNLLCAIARLLDGNPNALARALNRVLTLIGGGIPAGAVLSGLLPLNFVSFFERDGQVFANLVVRTADGTFVGPFAAPVEVVAAAPGTCTILNLVLGPIDLNILGLRVRLYGETPEDPITITITGETGPGNLLGNLLCAIVRLLDEQNPTPVQRLNTIIVLLNRILSILG